LIKQIEVGKKYWLVRTFGGKYYSHFIQNGYIAIGWNELSDLELIKQADRDSKIKNALYETAKKLLKNEKDQPGRIVNPIMRFVNEMNIGDIVVIPSENSKTIQFGVIKSDVKIVSDVINLDEGLDPLYKQRMVEWIAWREKDDVDLNIFKMLSSHYAISSADEYSESIDRTMYKLFTKDEKAFLIIDVNKEEELSGYEICILITKLLETVDVYNTITESSLDKNSVNMKVNLQSPGFIQLFGDIDTITAIYAVYILFIGGKITIKDIQYQFRGINDYVWEKILQYQDQKHKHYLEIKEQEFRHVMELLKVTFPKNQEVNSNQIED